MDNEWEKVDWESIPNPAWKDDRFNRSFSGDLDDLDELLYTEQLKRLSNSSSYSKKKSQGNKKRQGKAHWQNLGQQNPSSKTTFNKIWNQIKNVLLCREGI
uniref:Uncharacterized protein n=1 Tax=Aplanochytrium stocchinoi TaxID=215587 RepID=A0A7S3PIM2_9STRA|mmetsp:Transcript_4489/g.5188  ORF Transcript_4489/g.5188 Transcript_4489/m.5188 type:complete len:101 (+) Transcript_4489:169-471(+)